MKILEKYILRENFKPFVVSLIVITFVFMLDHLIDLLNMIIEKNLGLPMVGTLFGLSLPFILALAIPMSVLTASIMSFGRLAVDNEIVAFKSCGINIYTLLRPTIIASILLSFFMIYFNNSVLPNSNHLLKNLTRKAASRRPVTNIKSGIFTTMKKFTIYVKEQSNDELHGIIIYNNEDKNHPQTITAQRGNIELADGGNSLKAILYNGEMHVPDPKDSNKFQFRTFKKFTLNIPDLGFGSTQRDSKYRGDRELSSKAMREKIKIKQTDKNEASDELIILNKTISRLKKMESLSKIQSKELKKNLNLKDIKINKIKDIEKWIRIYEVEIYKKYAIAFACIVFVLIGAPVGMMTKTSSVGMAFSVSSIVFLIYHTTIIGGEELADRGIVSPMLAMWISNILLTIIGLYLIYLTAKENKSIDLLKYIKTSIFKIFHKKKIKEVKNDKY